MRKIIIIFTIIFHVLVLSGCTKEALKPDYNTQDQYTDTYIEERENTENSTEGGINWTEEPEMKSESKELVETEPIETEENARKEKVLVKELVIDELIITTDNKTIYGKIYMPQEEGKYPAVILSHGYNGSSSDFAKECEYFAENGYVAYAYDFCGGSTCSKSSGDTKDMTLFTEKNDLLAVYEYITLMDNVDPEQVFLFGASQGGMVSALVAEELKEKVTAMILYYPAFCIADDWRAKYPSIDNVPEAIDFWGMTLGRDFVRSIHDFYVFDTIGKYSGEVLIIYGENDPIVALGYMEKAKKVYKNAQLIVLENEAHGFSPQAGKYAMEKSLEFMMKQKGRTYPDNPFKEIPSSYLNECDKGGTIVSFSYETRNHRQENSPFFTKEALVYLPYGYKSEDKDTKYNVFYLMHGGSDSPAWYFNGVGKTSKLKNILDHLIDKGEMDPVIICAISYYTEYSNDAIDNCSYFHLELINDVIPAFETTYNTYAEDVSSAGLTYTRSRRAFGGFSMGAMTTWSVFVHCLDTFKYFMPISGDCWDLGRTYGGQYPDKTAAYLVNKVSETGWTAKDFKIYAGCGENDIAEPNLTPQIEAMKKFKDIFAFAENFSDGNLYHGICKAGGHDLNTVLKVLYNGLPKMFD